MSAGESAAWIEPQADDVGDVIVSALAEGGVDHLFFPDNRLDAPAFRNDLFDALEGRALLPPVVVGRARDELPGDVGLNRFAGLIQSRKIFL